MPFPRSVHRHSKRSCAVGASGSKLSSPWRLTYGISVLTIRSPSLSERRKQKDQNTIGVLLLTSLFRTSDRDVNELCACGSHRDLVIGKERSKFLKLRKSNPARYRQRNIDSQHVGGIGSEKKWWHVQRGAVSGGGVESGKNGIGGERCAVAARDVQCWTRCEQAPNEK